MSHWSSRTLPHVPRCKISTRPSHRLPPPTSRRDEELSGPGESSHAPALSSTRQPRNLQHLSRLWNPHGALKLTHLPPALCGELQEQLSTWLVSASLSLPGQDTLCSCWARATQHVPAEAAGAAPAGGSSSRRWPGDRQHQDEPCPTSVLALALLSHGAEPTRLCPLNPCGPGTGSLCGWQG